MSRPSSRENRRGIELVAKNRPTKDGKVGLQNWKNILFKLRCDHHRWKFLLMLLLELKNQHDGYSIWRSDDFLVKTLETTESTFRNCWDPEQRLADTQSVNDAKLCRKSEPWWFFWCGAARPMPTFYSCTDNWSVFTPGAMEKLLPSPFIKWNKLFLNLIPVGCSVFWN